MERAVNELQETHNTTAEMLLIEYRVEGLPHSIPVQ